MIETKVVCDRCSAAITDDAEYIIMPSRLVSDLRYCTEEALIDLCPRCRHDFRDWIDAGKASSAAPRVSIALDKEQHARGLAIRASRKPNPQPLPREKAGTSGGQGPAK